MKEIHYNLKTNEVDNAFRAAIDEKRKDEIVAAFYLFEVEKRQLFKELGYSSTIHYAKIAGSISERTAYYLLSIGKELESYKKIRQAFLNEEIGWTKVREILKVVDKINEDELLEQAKKLSRKELEDFVQCIKNKNYDYQPL